MHRPPSKAPRRDPARRRANLLYLPLLMVSFGLANVPVPRQVEQETEMNQTAAGTNRLANARSPYLLQHARHPVDWYP